MEKALRILTGALARLHRVFLSVHGYDIRLPCIGLMPA